MDDGGPTASIIMFLILLLVDAFFYGFGTASSSLNLIEIEKQVEEKDKKTAKLKKIISNPTGYVNTVQLVVTLVNLIFGMLYVPKWSHSVKDVLLLLLLLYILLSFGVLLPKRLAARNPEKWAYACITPIYFITALLKPMTGLISVTVSGILYLFGVREKENESDVTEEVIISMVNEGHEQGVIQASEAEMISNIFEYRDKEAQDIMTHRNNVIGVDGDMSLQDAVEFMLCEKNSRYPVYDENIDHIIGILHLKDAMRVMAKRGDTHSSVKETEGLLREAYFVPRTKNIDELFKEMQSEKLQMAIVVDEYGQTDGLVAMEDILEEIVGNIQDEYDEDREYIEDKGNDEYVMEGKTPLEELEERFDIHFDNEEFETLNGFLISCLDRIPEQDEDFDVDYQGYHFKILTVEHKMIQSVLVTKLPENREEKKEKTALQAVLEEKEK